MDDWTAQDQLDFQGSAASRNRQGLRLWVLVNLVLAGGAVLRAVFTAPDGPRGPFGLHLLVFAATTLAAFLAWRVPGRMLPLATPLSTVLVLASWGAWAVALVVDPSSLSASVSAFLLVGVAAGLVFTWRLPMAVGVQAGGLAMSLLAIHLGPGWAGDPAEVVPAGLVLAGAGLVSVSSQRFRLLLDIERMKQVREGRQATQFVDTERQRVRARGRDKDQLFSDVTNGLREPVVRMLRTIDQGMKAGPDEARRLRPLWQDGLRLLRKLDDVGTLALHDRGYLRLRAARLDLRQELALLLRPVRGLATGLDISIELHMDASPEDLHLDRARFQRVVLFMLAEAIRRCPEGDEIQVEVKLDPSAAGQDAVKIEVWLARPDEEVDRGREDDFWREPEGEAVELRLARALAELHGGRLTEPVNGRPELTWTLTLRSGTEHLSNELVDRRVRDKGGGRGRRFEDREGMIWAHELSESEEYRLLEIELLCHAPG